MNDVYSLNQSLRQSFIDKEHISSVTYQAALLTNDKIEGKKFLSTLLKELSYCDQFSISVAFVTNSGVATIINSLKDLEKNNIQGKVLVSQYSQFFLNKIQSF